MSIGTGVLRMQGKWEWGKPVLACTDTGSVAEGHTSPRFRNQLRALIVDGFGHVCIFTLFNEILFIFNSRSFDT
jgi:hypothetical protein